MDAIDRLQSWARGNDSDVAADLREVLPGLQRARVWKTRADQMEPAHRLHTLLHNGKDCWQHTDGETKRYYRLVAKLFVGELLAELEARRASVTTGGPNVAYNADGWQNGASSRPSTAPPEPQVVELPVSDDAHPYGNPHNCPCPNEAPPPQ